MFIAHSSIKKDQIYDPDTFFSSSKSSWTGLYAAAIQRFCKCKHEAPLDTWLEMFTHGMLYIAA